MTRLTLNALCNRPDLHGEALHHHLFQMGGMAHVQRSLQTLLTDQCIGVGFSAGGTALWQAALGQAALAPSPLKAVFCISSTRLRDLSALPIPNHVWFGANDPGIPSADWLASIPDQASVMDGVGHDFYRDVSDVAALNVKAALTKVLTQLIAI